jgi:hypothetical protein
MSNEPDTVEFSPCIRLQVMLFTSSRQNLSETLLIQVQFLLKCPSTGPLQYVPILI